MQRIIYVPGAIGAAPNLHTIPSGAPGIAAVIAAQIQRLPASLADHSGVNIVAAVADHAVHAHDLISQGLGGPVANPLGLPAGLNELNDAGAAALHTVPGAGATGVQNNAAVQAHAAGVAPVVHAGATPVVAAVPTRVNNTQFTLDVATLVGDLLTLIYVEVGELVRAS